MKLEDCILFDIPKILDERGNLSFAQNLSQIPFEIARTYWLYDVPGGESREGHAYKLNKEVVIALSGSFDVTIDDGITKKKFTLNRSYQGLYVPDGIWRSIDNFSTNAVQLILASEPFDESDYIRNYADYLSFKQQTR